MLYSMFSDPLQLQIMHCESNQLMVIKNYAVNIQKAKILDAVVLIMENLENEH